MLVFVEIGSWSNVQMSWGRGAVPGMVLSSNIPQAKKTWCQACRSHVYTVAYTIVQPQTPTGWMRMQQFLSPFLLFPGSRSPGSLGHLLDGQHLFHLCLCQSWLPSWSSGGPQKLQLMFCFDGLQSWGKHWCREAGSLKAGGKWVAADILQ